MAKKTTNSPEIKTVLHDEEYEIVYGEPDENGDRPKAKVRIFFDLIESQEALTEYARALAIARGVVTGDELSVNDPVLTFYSKQSALTPEVVQRKATAFYEREQKKAENDATFLTLFMHAPDFDQFGIEPENLRTQSRTRLPGLDEEPEIVPNFDHRVERRLGQIWSIFRQNPEIMAQVTDLARTLNVRVTRMLNMVEVDEAGFRS